MKKKSRAHGLIYNKLCNDFHLTLVIVVVTQIGSKLVFIQTPNKAKFSGQKIKTGVLEKRNPDGIKSHSPFLIRLRMCSKSDQHTLILTKWLSVLLTRQYLVRGILFLFGPRSPQPKAGSEKKKRQQNLCVRTCPNNTYTYNYLMLYIYPLELFQVYLYLPLDPFPSIQATLHYFPVQEHCAGH